MRVSPKGVEASQKSCREGATSNCQYLVDFGLLTIAKFYKILSNNYEVIFCSNSPRYLSKKKEYSMYKDVSMNISYYS